MSITKPNIHIKAGGKLQESYTVKKQKLARKRLEESKELADKIHPEAEEYSAPELSGESKINLV